MRSFPKTKKRAIIIGGSLGGLFISVLLQKAGWVVEVYERSIHELESRGGGIVLQPEVTEAFKQAGVLYKEPLGVIAKERYYLDKKGLLLQSMNMRQTLTSWGMLFGCMKRHFPAENYHIKKKLVDLKQDETEITAFFEDGTSETADLLIGADGPLSTVRELMIPNSKPDYAGYVAYRGLVDEKALPKKTAELFTERFVFYQFPNSHILQYVIPGKDESLELGKRRFNWVWYVNYEETKELPGILIDKDGKQHNTSISPGKMHPEVERSMQTYAAEMLPPPFKILVAATKEPFVQSIQDYGAPKMAFGRVALLGDAAFIPRPHTAASTSKAASNALALVQSLADHDHNVEASLLAWEPGQLALGRYFIDQGRALGTQSQFSFGKNRCHNSDLKKN
jgi:2-polyprenyl-6-methoxyphenol hydroxylase-like FAD-dependent oxidoreductase